MGDYVRFLYNWPLPQTNASCAPVAMISQTDEHVLDETTIVWSQKTSIQLV